MLGFKIKQYLKMIMQNVIFPCVYKIGKIRRVNSKLVVFADSHHNEVPYSMEDIYKWFQGQDYNVVQMTRDCDQGGYLGGLRYMVRFMFLYARAHYVFLCDNFLPVASCNKRQDTIVVQMWHAGGMLKKYAYDTTRDIPAYYRGNVFKNYSLIITSDKNCIPAYESGMRASIDIIKPLGLSRTDRFYCREYKEKCKEHFQELYPQYRDKKIALWAPTFRGNASIPGNIDMKFLKNLQEELGTDWQVITKLHPHLEKKIQLEQCSIATEQLLPVTDVLISDYSSVIYDYVLLEKPMVLYAPDLKKYKENNEFYIDYNEMPGRIVEDKKLLANAIRNEYQNYSIDRIRQFKNKYMSACDGHAMLRLIEYLKL